MPRSRSASLQLARPTAGGFRANHYAWLDTARRYQTKDFNAFIRHLDELADQVEDLPLRLREDVLRHLFERIVARTPVDTGLASANWQMANATNREILPASAAGLKARVQQGVDYMGQVYVFNNVPYIRFLEYGSSTIPNPPAPVANAIMDAERYSRSLARRYGLQVSQ